MAEPALMYCVGATKSGTTWLYEHLAAHPACHLRPVKEAHYWDTAEPGRRAQQVSDFRKRLRQIDAGLLRAIADGDQTRVARLDRQAQTLVALIAMLEAPRDGHAAYRHWLMDGAGPAALVADITPAYGILPQTTLHEMRSAAAATRFVYIMRDPLDRLWSHVRMQARRTLRPSGDYKSLSHKILRRILTEGGEPQIVARGDYIGTVTALRAVVPACDLHLTFAEDLFAPEGLRRLSAFLGIAYRPGTPEKAHAGEALPMREDLRPRVAAFLQDQYEWVAAHVGPLPARWRDNLQGAMA